MATKLKQLLLQAGPEGTVQPGTIRIVDDATAKQLVAARAAQVLDEDEPEKSTPKNETAKQRAAREKAEREAAERSAKERAAAEKADADAKAKDGK
jgi:hypothetical protein